MTYNKALCWSGFWIVSALMFACGIGYYQGQDNAYTFLTGYIVEKMLSFDNLFMFYVIFQYMGLSSSEQRSVLNYGIIGAVILRGLFILSGCFLVNEFTWLIYLFAAFLVYSGYKILISKDDEPDPDGHIDRIKKWFPNYGLFITSIIVIEITDLMFALDSIPAILSITQNSFLVLSSNLFAILGLRSLYFVMLNLIKKFTYLQYCVGIILMFIGTKMLVKSWYEIDTIMSLSFIISIILTGIVLSKTRELL
jgi:tellurite resistance protein TerC